MHVCGCMSLPHKGTFSFLFLLILLNIICSVRLCVCGRRWGPFKKGLEDSESVSVSVSALTNSSATSVPQKKRAHKKLNVCFDLRGARTHGAAVNEDKIRYSVRYD